MNCNITSPKNYHIPSCPPGASNMRPKFFSLFGGGPKMQRLNWRLQSSNSKTLVSEEPLRNIDVDGIHRHFFYKMPLVQNMVPVYTLSEDQDDHPSPKQTVLTKSIQTDYRESDTQTLPWTPPFNIKGDEAPEVLTLAVLSWGHGLPAGPHEVEVIELARIRRAWEHSVSSVTGKGSLEKRKQIIDALEREQWALREKEIQRVDDLRLHLLHLMLHNFQKTYEDKISAKLMNLIEKKEKEKEQKIHKMILNKNRVLRKLTVKHKGINLRYHKENIIDSYANPTSELYGPLLRFGENPKRRHEVISIQNRFLSHIKGLEILENMPKWNSGHDYSQLAAPRSKHTELCIRETRWTDEILTKLHNDLKAIRMHVRNNVEEFPLVTKIQRHQSLTDAPFIEGIRDWEENVYQSAILMQTLIKSRAIQMMMFQGREKYKMLIEDYKRTKALYSAQIQRVMKDRLATRLAQRELAVSLELDKKWLEVCASLEGQTVSGMLDFLSKELVRLQDERRCHAFALLAERERTMREAAESGRRQAEERRRREHDEMFKQLMKVHQDTVDLYLEDIIIESIDARGEEEARDYVKEITKKINETANAANERSSVIEQEELISTLVHNFLIPETEKVQVRKRFKVQQEKYLRAAHAAIYDHQEPEDHEEIGPDLEFISDLSESVEWEPEFIELEEIEIQPDSEYRIEKQEYVGSVEQVIDVSEAAPDQVQEQIQEENQVSINEVDETNLYESQIKSVDDQKEETGVEGGGTVDETHLETVDKDENLLEESAEKDGNLRAEDPDKDEKLPTEGSNVDGDLKKGASDTQEGANQDEKLQTEGSNVDGDLKKGASDTQEGANQDEKLQTEGSNVDGDLKKGASDTQVHQEQEGADQDEKLQAEGSIKE